MNKIYDTNKNGNTKQKKKYKNRVVNKNKVIKYLLRIHDKNSKYFIDKLNFLKDYEGNVF